ncbi:hypothetical protein COT78_00565 [Candidatus Berkelbacteria bacterium CG10_big_fil_rev_8_21_14_0_10_43_13]|uniref:Uncharacterized protein n=1 Tax=Candidatus Berkelbacteria bacterium CG10_big_fil_rev_8_21_14_0_10_43_13 TaxID=1974514 RepID=A0A2H0W7A1_9BACT|nr:MAG: hypothetical protein COT78_00565 [Candidatus Berkelbacteria bacterium CG10_big_fil_rev_8_21_14_0_10_43_13]
MLELTPDEVIALGAKIASGSGIPNGLPTACYSGSMPAQIRSVLALIICSRQDDAVREQQVSTVGYLKRNDQQRYHAAARYICDVVELLDITKLQTCLELFNDVPNLVPQTTDAAE